MTLADNYKNISFGWQALYNALYILTINEKEVKEFNALTFPTVEPLPEELESALDLGLHVDNLTSYLNKRWITESQKTDLENFYSYSSGILPEYWNEHDILHHDEWYIARAWAGKLFSEIGFTRNGFETSGVQLVHI